MAVLREKCNITAIQNEGSLENTLWVALVKKWFVDVSVFGEHLNPKDHGGHVGVGKSALIRRFCKWLTVTKMATESTKDTETKAKRVQDKKLHNTRLYLELSDRQWPIIYSQDYNIGFLGLEKLHPFDAGKWGKVFAFLKEDGMIRDDTIVAPREASEEDLLVVHTKRYVDSLKQSNFVEKMPEWSINVATITEVPPVALLPNFIVQRKVLKPFRFQAGGTILAGKLAVERGWAINIGGGFHHCSADRGGGFCAYADITLAIKFLFDRVPSVKKAMIVDLDAHQGNGHERDFMEDNRVYIMDVYNRHIYPHDGFAKRAIKRKVELMSYTEDAVYLQKVRDNLRASLEEFTPDIIVYNAGTDILDGDPLGALSISPEGIIERDQIVFEAAQQRRIPILMVTSGGYQKRTARIIANSILNLRRQNLIGCPDAEAFQAETKSTKLSLFSGATGGSTSPTKPMSKLS